VLLGAGFLRPLPPSCTILTPDALLEIPVRTSQTKEQPACPWVAEAASTKLDAVQGGEAANLQREERGSDGRVLQGTCAMHRCWLAESQQLCT
jgi:hypothetical protein